MKYSVLLLLFFFPVFALTEGSKSIEKETPVYFYRGGSYSSRGVLCRYPRVHIRRFGPCPYYPHWEYRIDFDFKRPENHELRNNIANFHLESLQEDPQAQFMLASYYERGLGLPRDLSKAYAWYKISSNNGNESAQYRLDKLVERTSSKLIERGEEQVFALYEEIESFNQQKKPSLSDEIEDSMLFSQKNAQRNVLRYED